MADDYSAKDAAGATVVFASEDVGAGKQMVKHTIPDGKDVTLGAKADARSTATDTTPVTEMQVLKEISYMEQNPATRAVTKADGSDVAQGSTTDAAASTSTPQDTTPRTGIGLWKGLLNVGIAIKALLPTALGGNGGFKVEGVAGGTAVPVSGAFYQVTQPVSAASGQIASGAVASGAMVAGSQVDGHSVTMGLTTSTPAVGVEDGTARNEVSLLKGIKNTLYNGGAAFPVKGTGFSVRVDFTVDAGAYTIGDALAAMGTFAGMASGAGKHAIINTITLAANDALPALPLTLWILNADLATGIAKNAAFVIVAADGPKVMGIIGIAAGDYFPSQTSWNIATLRGVGLEITTVATSVYVYLVCGAATAPVATHVYLTLTGEFID
jgi:hypothetical protein